MILHKTPGVLPTPHVTARIVRGAVTNRVVVLGPRGGGKGLAGTSSAPAKARVRNPRRQATGKRAK